jgi:luciferase family oxidoreductase group 1
MLEALHPGRIDLGIGRAPGTDSVTALALRRSRLALTADDFPDQLDELLSFFSGGFPEGHPFRRITPMPADVATPDIWLLGSTTFSAHLAAVHGLGYAFAHHIHPGPAVEALQLYRERFHPSSYLAEPRTMIGTSVICAESDARAEELAQPALLNMLRLRQGRLGPLPTIDEAKVYPYTAEEREVIQASRERIFIGSPAAVEEQLTRLTLDAGVDEVMVTTMTHNHQDRRRSYELLANLFLKPSLQVQ